MTFKTKFRIGQEVLYKGEMVKIQSVSIFVGENIKQIKYCLDSGEELPFIVEEIELRELQRALDV